MLFEFLNFILRLVATVATSTALILELRNLLNKSIAGLLQFVLLRVNTVDLLLNLQSCEVSIPRYVLRVLGLVKAYIILSGNKTLNLLSELMSC